MAPGRRGTRGALADILPETREFSPKAARIILFMAWAWVGMAISYLASLVAPGIGGIVVYWAVFISLLLVGGHRCREMTLVLGPNFVRIVNPFRTYRVPVEPPFQVTLRRVAMPVSANEERALSARGLMTMNWNFPAVAFRSAGALSAPAAVSLWIGPRSRTCLLHALSDWASTVGATVEILTPNRGGLAGLSWDIRVGRGMAPPHVGGLT